MPDSRLAGTLCKECPLCGLPTNQGDVTLLERAYAEIRKQVFGSGVVFDREIVELARAAGSPVAVYENPPQPVHKCPHFTDGRHRGWAREDRTCQCGYQWPMRFGVDIGLPRGDASVLVAMKHTEDGRMIVTSVKRINHCPPGCLGICIGDGNHSGCKCPGEGCDCPNHPTEKEP